ncbi:MAG: SCO family protein [Anaerolineales bacterium]
MRRLYWVGLSLLLFFSLFAISLFLWQREARTLRGTVYEPPLPAADFTLIQTDGTPFRLSDRHGKIVLLFFGYTYCPDVCPTTLAELRQALSALDEKQRQQVEVVFISVDPARDTPERAQEYARRFSPSFIGLSGSEEALQPIWQAYGVYREIQSSDSAAGYLVAHSARVYLIDPNGYLRLTFPFGIAPDDIAHDLKNILRETR